jgi:hypothetical protein
MSPPRQLRSELEERERRDGRFATRPLRAAEPRQVARSAPVAGDSALRSISYSAHLSPANLPAKTALRAPNRFPSRQIALARTESMHKSPNFAPFILNRRTQTLDSHRSSSLQDAAVQEDLCAATDGNPTGF